MIHLPRGAPVREKVNPARINLPEAMLKLRNGDFTGYLRFDAPQGTGVILFRTGQLISATFLTGDESHRLIAYDAIARIFETSIIGHAVLTIFRLDKDLVLALHALLHGRYLEQGLELRSFDVARELERIRRDGMTACLRVYAGDRTTLIFYDQGYALGFFHDGGVELEQTADLGKSIAQDPDARLDILEVRNAEEIILADLMQSADLRPIWQRSRKQLLEERRRQEEQSIKQQQESFQRRHAHTLAVFKTIAANHIGKFGVTQVDKAYQVVGPEMSDAQLEQFYRELEKLARLVAGRSKIDAMIKDMKEHRSQEA